MYSLFSIKNTLFNTQKEKNVNKKHKKACFIHCIYLFLSHVHSAHNDILQFTIAPVVDTRHDDHVVVDEGKDVRGQSKGSGRKSCLHSPEY